LRLVRFVGEGLAGVALSVMFTLGVFSLLPVLGLFALGVLGISVLVFGLFFLWAYFMLPSLVIGIIFLRRKAKVFGWAMITTGAVISLWIQFAVMTGGLGF
jgi:hypothetical protein